MKKAFFAVMLLCSSAFAAQETVPLGTLLDAVALNAGASYLTFYIGKYTRGGTPTSATDASEAGSPAVRGFDRIKLEVSYDYGATTVALTLTCTEGQTRSTATGVITTSTYNAGTYTLEASGVITTPSMAADTIYPIEFYTRHAPVIKCIVSSSGSPGATDKVTVTGWAIKD